MVSYRLAKRSNIAEVKFESGVYHFVRRITRFVLFWRFFGVEFVKILVCPIVPK
ncbi:MAG: hypothetical protein LBC74_10545 [Planctomycetaceae bacterium]|nr:hypothetical protein [Planctomycetaceae bacterium]